MQLKRLVRSQVEFAFECLKELRGGLRYTPADFLQYLEQNKLLEHSDYCIKVAVVENKLVGILTCNRFAMPRYLGFGIELEEVIIHPDYQGLGHGKKMLACFFEQIKNDQSIRKVLVKTDDQLKAGKLYQQYCDVVETTVYSKTNNYL
jgi:GNAT superfamily N-acetyltransferase